MDTKLTLKLDNEIIERAKIYASSRKVSLSSLIEHYLKMLTSEVPSLGKMNISPFVKSLSSDIGLPVDYDYKNERAAYLEKKYR